MQELAEKFTDALTAFMEEHFRTFAKSKGQCDSGSQVEKLVRNWAYMVRFADWCFHDGPLLPARVPLLTPLRLYQNHLAPLCCTPAARRPRRP
jgi:hypothetical protein